MEFLERNRRAKPPVGAFEIGNVVILDPDTETRTREERRLCFASMGPEAGYAGIRSALDALLAELGLERSLYEATSLPYFIEGRAARVLVEGREVARAGEVHPEVLNNFRLSYPVALGEVLLGDVDIAGGFAA
jgi:phenylalanyl-tRNA synthetase beta chain